MDFLLISIKVADEECSFATFIVILTGKIGKDSHFKKRYYHYIYKEKKLDWLY